ncbi:MAG: HD domain-containing protein [Patescibacteria group bacterium]
MPTIVELQRFYAMLVAYRRVVREIYTIGEERMENDVEHSYTLVMLAWYVASTLKLSLDQDKVMRYALVHDLVEVYAGDVFAFTKDAKAKSEKAEREHAAAERLRGEFPEFFDLHATIAAYERREDPESRFIYALDKLEPMLTTVADGGRIWRKHGLTLEELIAQKCSRMAGQTELLAYLEELAAQVASRHHDFFGKATGDARLT